MSLLLPMRWSIPQIFAYTELAVNLAVADKWGLYSFMYYCSKVTMYTYVSVKKRGRGRVYFATRSIQANGYLMLTQIKSDLHSS